MWFFPAVALAEDAPAEAARVEAHVDALLAEGRRREAEIAARAGVAAAPDRADAWLLLGRVVADPEEARRFVRRALALDPDHPGALLALGRSLHASGASVDAVVPLRRASEAGLAEASLQLAIVRRVLGDREAAIEVARRAVAQDPRAPEAWLFLARAEGPAALDEGLAALPDDPELRVARAAEHLRLGDVEAAEASLQGVNPDHAEATRLRALVACARAGALDAAGVRAVEQARRAAVRAGAFPLGDRLVERYPSCGATWLARAAERRARGDEPGALADLERAVELLPGDAAAAGAYGLALHAAGRSDEALPWLTRASAARPADVELLVARAESASSVGRPAEARAAAEAVLAKASRGTVAAALAALAGDEAAFAVLLRAVARDPEPRTVEVAREVGRRLGREHEVTALLTMPRLPASGGGGAAEEITVYASRASDRARARLEGHLERMGYAPGVVLRDRTVFSAAPDRPALTLWHDGRIDMQSAGTLPGEGRFAGASGTLPKWYTRKRMSPKRYAVVDGAREEIRAWRDTLAREGLVERVERDLSHQLDALWREGVPLSGGQALATRDARRRALLAHWASRTCDEYGWIVRDAIRAFLVEEVQTSDAPVTAAELEEAHAASACGRLEL